MTHLEYCILCPMAILGLIAGLWGLFAGEESMTTEQPAALFDIDDPGAPILLMEAIRKASRAIESSSGTPNWYRAFELRMLIIESDYLRSVALQRLKATESAALLAAQRDLYQEGKAADGK